MATVRKRNWKWFLAPPSVVVCSHHPWLDFLFTLHFALFCPEIKVASVKNMFFLHAVYYVDTRKRYQGTRLETCTESPGQVCCLHLANSAISHLWYSDFDNVFPSLIVFLVSTVH